MADGVTIAVQGLREFNRSLRRLDSEAPKGLRLALNGVADFVVGKIQPTIPRRSGKARASLKKASTRTAAKIRVGGSKAPYFPWLDYGGKTGPNRSVSRPFIKTGRYVYPGLAKHRAEVATLIERALADLAKDAGLELD